MEVLSIHYFQQRSHCFWNWGTFEKRVPATGKRPAATFKSWKDSTLHPVQSKIWCRYTVLSGLPFSCYNKVTNGTQHRYI